VLRVLAVDETSLFNGKIGGPSYAQWRGDTRAFDVLAAYMTTVASMTGTGLPTRLVGAEVSASFFSVLPTPPVVGRTFREDEERPAPGVVILSESLWTARFGRSEGILGTVVRLNDQNHRVIGVMGKQFVFPQPETQFWIPLFPHVRLWKSPDGKPTVSIPKVQVLGRLAPHASRDDALAEAKYALNKEGRQIAVTSLKSDMVRRIQPALLALQGAVSLLLLLACANVACLLLARSAERAGGVAVRLALGASRRRVIRDMLVESTLLSMLGGSIGLFVAWLVFAGLLAVSPESAKVAALGTDKAVIGYAVVLTIATGILSGLAPAMRVSKAELVATLHGQHGRGSGRTPRSLPVLVCVQLALAVCLSSAALALMYGFVSLIARDPGFNWRSVAAVEIHLPRDRADSRLQLIERLLSEARALPTVQAAAVTSRVPLPRGEQLFALDRQEEEPGVVLIRDRSVTRIVAVSHAYFAVMQIPAVAGRLFNEHDTAVSMPSVVLSQNVAARSSGLDRAVGGTLEFGGRLWTVIGVAGDVREHTMDSAPAPLAYFLDAQLAWTRPRLPVDDMTLVARTRGAPEVVLAALSRRLQHVDESMIVDGGTTLQSRLYRSIGPINFYASVMVIFAFLALALAGVGLFGLLSLSVARRSREIAIRMALGAERNQVFSLVVRDGMALTAAGGLCGWPLAIAANRVLNSVVLGLPPTPLLVPLVAVLVLSAVALFACLGPAFRATGLHPAVALRAE
jgi:predicted permease